MNILKKIFPTFLLFFEIYLVQAYRKYYVEDECTSPDEFQKVFFKLLPTGADSVGELRSNRFGTYSRTGRNCLLKLVPPEGYGVLVTILLVDFRNHEECKDFIKIYEKDENGDKLCRVNETRTNSKTYFSDSELFIHYHTAVGGMGFSKGFRLIFTVTKLVGTDGAGCFEPDEFQCKNSHCIWSGATCDGINNCGDDSDENPVDHPHCNRVPPIAIAAVVLGIISFVGVLVLTCLCCCRPQTPSFSKPTHPENVPLRPHVGYTPLPGYTYEDITQDTTFYQPMHSTVLRASVNQASCPWDKQQKCNINYEIYPPPPYVV